VRTKSNAMDGEGTDSPDVLKIRVAQGPADWAIAHQMLDDEHLLGAGREAGDRLCQFVLEGGQPVAVLVWCAAAWHLKDRDERIGWDAVTRSQRLKLIVQLRRFLVLEASRRPNLASRCLGLALRELCAAWSREHGYRPLLAESFSDPESHHGTVYKATNWTCAGDTKGFSQDHTDYYIPNNRPKKLWLKPLAPKALVLMCAPQLPDDCAAAEVGRGGVRSPLKTSQLKSLRSAFELVEDPRRAQSRRHPLTAMLTLIALGLLMGGRDMLNIWRKVACLDQRQREAIGLRVRHKESGLLKMPGYDALNDLFHLLDPTAYAHALTVWLQANNGLLPRSLALDGKNIGDGKCGMIITLCRHEDGRPVAMIPATGEKEDCEVSEARALLADPQVRLENALVTADPLHNKQDTVRVIAEKGGDYLIGTKDNTPKRHEAVVNALRATPFSP
jgi:Domain of unknown function (DUF4338)/DDE_Tnp_1-associated